SRNYRSGFLSRAAQAVAGETPIAFTAQLPLNFRGGEAVPNIALEEAARRGIAGRNAELIAAMYEGQELAPAVAQGFAVRAQVYDAISQEMRSANRDAVSPRGCELAAQRIGLLMRDRYNLG